MKKLSIILILGVFFTNLKCKQEPFHVVKNRVVTLNAEFDKSSPILMLGDTLTLGIVIPDTILLHDKLKNIIEQVPVKDVEYCVLSLRYRQIDTTAKIVTYDYLDVDINYLPQCGIERAGTITANFCLSKKPYEAVVRFVPTKKGLFFIEIPNPLNSNLIMNSRSIEAVTEVYITNSNKNLELLLPYLEDFVNSPTRTNDLYAFKVE